MPSKKKTPFLTALNTDGYPTALARYFVPRSLDPWTPSNRPWLRWMLLSFAYTAAGFVQLVGFFALLGAVLVLFIPHAWKGMLMVLAILAAMNTVFGVVIGTLKFFATSNFRNRNEKS